MNNWEKYQKLLQTNPDLFTNKDAIFIIVTDSEIINNWKSDKKKQLIQNNLPENWADIGVVYEDPYILVVRDLVQFPSGIMGTYFRLLNTADLNGGKGTVILPIIKNKILLLHQYRHATRNWHWEIPRGFGEPETPSVENAIKEISEEVSGEISKLVDLGPYHSNTGIEGVVVELFYAVLKSVGIPNQDEGISSFELFDVEKVNEMIANAEITDGFTIAAYTRAKLKGLI